MEEYYIIGDIPQPEITVQSSNLRWFINEQGKRFLQQESRSMITGKTFWQNLPEVYENKGEKS